MTVPDSPFFIIGTERSGSNLLRLILTAHTRIEVPHPPHIVRYFAPLESGYGDLAHSDRAFAALVDDILMLVRLHIYPWPFLPDRGRVWREAPSRDALGVTAALYDQCRERARKARWGCKSTFMIHYTDRIRALFPDARLIFLTRDPRDVAASSRRSVFNPFHPYCTARLWAHQQRLGLDLLEQLPAESIQHIRYEDLIARPQESVARVCAFLGEEFEPRMLRFFDTAEARKSASLSRSWANTGRDIIASNAGKYRVELTRAEVQTVEGVARAEMERLGYIPDFPPARPPSRFKVVGYRLLDLATWARVEFRSLVSDRNHWRRWARDLAAFSFRVRRQPRLHPRRATHAPTG